MTKQAENSEGYLTVGEAAKIMNVSVRTLQYYDKQGLMSPSTFSAGGRRLYTYKDLVALHQILSLKHLGFSLKDIKNRLIPLNTKEEVAEALADQARVLREKIDNLSQSLKEVEALRGEVLQMEVFDFKVAADIILNLQLKNEFYWLIKHFDGPMLDYIRQRFTRETGQDFIQRFMQLQAEAIRLQENHEPTDSDQAAAFAKTYWDMIEEFTNGDPELLSRLVEIGKFENADAQWKATQEKASAFIEPALAAYFKKSKRGKAQEEKS